MPGIAILMPFDSPPDRLPRGQFHDLADLRTVWQRRDKTLAEHLIGDCTVAIRCRMDSKVPLGAENSN